MTPAHGTLARMIFNMVKDDSDPTPTMDRVLQLVKDGDRRHVARALADDFRNYQRNPDNTPANVIIGWLAGVH